MESLGVADILLTRPRALEGLDMLIEEGLIVVGEDVYYRIGTKFELEVQSWSTNRREGESRDDLLHRSYDKAINFIKNFRDTPGKETFFSLVIRPDDL